MTKRKMTGTVWINTSDDVFGQDGAIFESRPTLKALREMGASMDDLTEIEIAKATPEELANVLRESRLLGYTDELEQAIMGRVIAFSASERDDFLDAWVPSEAYNNGIARRIRDAASAMV
jgi:hypothetical protein